MIVMEVTIIITKWQMERIPAMSLESAKKPLELEQLLILKDKTLTNGTLGFHYPSVKWK